MAPNSVADPAPLSADYLVIGAGAQGLAFLDTLLLGNPSATAVLVDRYERPGGHWTTAYPFVRLHQPTQFYGVASVPMGSGRVEASGGNKGLAELAPASEVCAYFNNVLHGKLLPTGRLTYLPLHDYDEASNSAVSLLSGARTPITAKKIVDSAYSRVVVPSMRPPPFPVAPGTTIVAVNGLPKAIRPDVPRYCVLGSGKTGVDAVTFLIEMGLDPARITWVMPRDVWHIDRASMQPGGIWLPHMLEVAGRTADAVSKAESIVDFYHRMEEAGAIMRPDGAMEPVSDHCGNITRADLEMMRSVKDVVRMGRVTAIEEDGMVLEKGKREMPKGTVYVDCTANGLARRPPVKVFQEGRIVIQPIHYCQQVYSAAAIAHLENTYPSDDARKNAAAMPVPHPDTPADAVKSRVIDARNRAAELSDPLLRRWHDGCRLNFWSYFAPGILDLPEEQYEAACKERAAGQLAVAEVLEGLLRKEGHKLYDSEF
ncbi:pyridine nucleotide-disulfide oxidoreductase-domain-containing protein [Hyaloraphidium curvatum]|nr:pyridine nucleotide-disulfide oxidoreductase-domain-containing protein [Hyaloraphidium curvatum]